MTFAEYLVQNLYSNLEIWRNNWFGPVHDLPEKISRIMPYSFISKKDLADSRKNDGVKGLLRATLKQQGILAIMLILMQLDEKDVNTAVKRTNQLHALLEQKYAQEMDSKSQTSSLPSLNWKDFIFPGFDYATCSDAEIRELHQFFGNALIKAIQPSASNEVPGSVGFSGAVGLNLEVFLYDKLPIKIQVHINKHIGEENYKNRLAKAIQVNTEVRDITLNITSIVDPDSKAEVPLHHRQLCGFTNIEEIAQIFIEKYYAIHPMVKTIKPQIVKGLSDTGLLFIRNDRIDHLLRYLFDKIEFNNIANEVSKALNNDYFSELEKKDAQDLKKLELEKAKGKAKEDSDEKGKVKFSRSLSSSALPKLLSRESSVPTAVNDIQPLPFVAVPTPASAKSPRANSSSRVGLDLTAIENAKESGTRTSLSARSRTSLSARLTESVIPSSSTTSATESTIASPVLTKSTEMANTDSSSAANPATNTLLQKRTSLVGIPGQKINLPAPPALVVPVLPAPVSASRKSPPLTPAIAPASNSRRVSPPQSHTIASVSNRPISPPHLVLAGPIQVHSVPKTSDSPNQLVTPVSISAKSSPLQIALGQSPSSVFAPITRGGSVDSYAPRSAPAIIPSAVGTTHSPGFFPPVNPAAASTTGVISSKGGNSPARPASGVVVENSTASSVRTSTPGRDAQPSPRGSSGGETTGSVQVRVKPAATSPAATPGVSGRPKSITPAALAELTQRFKPAAEATAPSSTGEPSSPATTVNRNLQ